MSVTLITGCSTGIGKATAIHLARAGYHVFASMRNSANRADEIKQIADDENLKLEVVELDVNSATSCEQTVKSILDKHGNIDVLVNNAGIAAGGMVEDFPEANIRAMFETNYFGAMRLIRLVLPSMREAQHGAIINVTSIMGILARAGGSAYSSTKFALEAASESLAQEVRRFNIRVAMIQPGVIDTPLHSKSSDSPETSSHYQEFDERGARLFGKLLENPSPPELVAQTIQHAIETENPKLRYLVGEDAKKWAAGRKAMTDEEWADVGLPMTLDEYVAFYRDRFDMEI